MRTLLKRVVPRRLYDALRIGVRRVKHFGLSRRCPLCGARLRRFVPYKQRAEAGCGVCSSMERHRLMWLYFRERTDLLDGRPKRVLHIAPEWSIAQALSRLPHLDYVGGDLNPAPGQQRIDITDIPYTDDSFDVIYCSHVLEHVPDDRKAMAELYRVLKPGGWAVLQVPIDGETTFEDWSVQTPEERERVFGQWDHVRIYGKDYRDRLEAAGFTVRVEEFGRDIDERTQRRLGLGLREDVYRCAKPRTPSRPLASAVGHAGDRP